MVEIEDLIRVPRVPRRLIDSAPKIHLGECIKYTNPRWPGWLAKSDDFRKPRITTKKIAFHPRLFVNTRFKAPRSSIARTDEEILARFYTDAWVVNGKPIYHAGLPYIPIARAGRVIGYKDRFKYWYIWPSNQHIFHWACQCPIAEEQTPIASYLDSRLREITMRIEQERLD